MPSLTMAKGYQSRLFQDSQTHNMHLLSNFHIPDGQTNTITAKATLFKKTLPLVVLAGMPLVPTLRSSLVLPCPSLPYTKMVSTELFCCKTELFCCKKKNYFFVKQNYFVVKKKTIIDCKDCTCDKC